MMSGRRADDEHALPFVIGEEEDIIYPAGPSASGDE
jgi:hypothetical protein